MKPLAKKITIGISACLLGQKVRHDAGHKKDKFIVNTLGEYFDFIPTCPEVAIGMGIPRPTIHLEGQVKDPKVVGVMDKSIDVTTALTTFSHKKIKTFTTISGYILKANSPTCGMERVRVYQGHGKPPKRSGVGIFAKALMTERSELPIEEEGRLNDPVLRENFIERVFMYRRWQELKASTITPRKLVQFHSTIKLALMAHNISGYKRLGQMIATIPKQNLICFSQAYIKLVMVTLKTPATRKKNANVLQHCLGYLKKDLSSKDKQELLDIIDAYRLNQIPLIVPITLLKHHFNHYPKEYIAHQTFLNPYPKELMLRNLI